MSEPPNPTNAATNEPVTLINPFTVRPEESDQFLHRWMNNARIMAAQPGLVRARMYRSLSDQVPLRYINVAEWDSGRALDTATADPWFRASVQRLLDDPRLQVTGQAAVYQVAIEIHPGDLL